MEVTFTVAKDDLAAARIFLSNNLGGKDSGRVLNIYLPLFVIFFLLASFFLNPIRLPDSVTTLTNNLNLYLNTIVRFVVFLFCCVWLLFGDVRRKLKDRMITQEFDTFYKVWLLGEQRLVLNGDGITLVNNKEWKYGWTDIQMAAEDEKYVFIFMKGETENIVIPKKDMAAGSASEIIGILRSGGIYIFNKNKR